MWQQRQMALKHALSTEQTSPSFLVQNYYFGNFPSEGLEDSIYKTFCPETLIQRSKICKHPDHIQLLPVWLGTSAAMYLGHLLSIHSPLAMSANGQDLS